MLGLSPLWSRKILLVLLLARAAAALGLTTSGLTGVGDSAAVTAVCAIAPVSPKASIIPAIILFMILLSLLLLF
jgi:hypothetical protein